MVLALMFQGTGSDVGKSVVVAGLCRLLRGRGLRVKPFKPQNMSNNAAVTADGGEIGRAQALQARACGVMSSVLMNPVLLKPQGGMGVQVIVCGKVLTSCSASEYSVLKRDLLPKVVESFHTLAKDTDMILIEGAGSPAEINLREGDIANMGFAEAIDVPVVLIGDIDRGGVIASIVGTYALLSTTEQRRLKGYIINKFRGDPSLFTQGLQQITTRTGLRSLGVVPYCSAVRRLPAEDTLGLTSNRREGRGVIRIAVPRLPCISNFDDFDPLRLESDVCFEVVEEGEVLPVDSDVIILPGSKSTIGDLRFFRGQGWDIDLQAHYRRGGYILGLCGGFQMLGRSIRDTVGYEGMRGVVEGLGLLDVETVLCGSKTLSFVRGRHCGFDTPIEGYEIHLGKTTGTSLSRPFLELESDGGRRFDGVVSCDGRVSGCYVHGLFGSDAFRHRFLAQFRGRRQSEVVFEEVVEYALDEWAGHLSTALDVDRILEFSGK